MSSSQKQYMYSVLRQAWKELRALGGKAMVVLMKTPSPLPLSTTFVSPVTSGTPASRAARIEAARGARFIARCYARLLSDAREKISGAARSGSHERQQPDAGRCPPHEGRALTCAKRTRGGAMIKPEPHDVTRAEPSQDRHEPGAKRAKVREEALWDGGEGCSVH